jgi:hypothetical protein
LTAETEATLLGWRPQARLIAVFHQECRRFWKKPQDENLMIPEFLRRGNDTGTVN